MPFYPLRAFIKSSFSIIKDSLLQSDHVPLADLIDEQEFAIAFKDHGVKFGQSEDAIYTPAITLWGLISQVFFDKENRSCKAAVMRISLLWAARGQTVCDTNNGDYCRARLQIPFEAVRQITTSLAQRTESTIDHDQDSSLVIGSTQQLELLGQTLAPETVAEVKRRPVAGRILLLDGFTVTAADTPDNQQEWPQNPAQKEGIGFPILRCLSLISMVTGLLVDLVEGPYSGKLSGETSLARQLMDHLRPGDILVADCYLCTYFIVAACQLRGAEIVMKNHHRRSDDPLGSFRYNGHERTTQWDRPERPEWMSDEEYDLLPERLVIRLVDVSVDKKGFRPDRFTIATTIMDRSNYPASWIASVYRSRWLVELDIRSIKESLHMDILRAKSPPMVRTELWSCLLAYNLIRIKMLQSGVSSVRDVRSMSFTSTLQLISSGWVLLAVIGVTDALAQLGQSAPADEVVGNRPDRFEPRVNKRRPKILALMTKPRAMYRMELDSNLAA